MKPRFSDVPLMWMERAATSMFQQTIVAPEIWTLMMCNLTVLLFLQVFLELKGTEFTSMDTQSVTAGRLACG